MTEHEDTIKADDLEATPAASTETAVEHSGPEGASAIDVFTAIQKFDEELKLRSFAGRNPELGKMIKCAQCGLRHRDSVKHEDPKYVVEAATKKFRGTRNPFWRSRPGLTHYIPALKKYVRITQ